MIVLQAGTESYVIGISTALLAALLFAITNIIYKRFDREISIFEIVATRMWIGFPLALLLILPPFNPDGVRVTFDGILILTFSMATGALLGDGCYFASQSMIGVSKAYPIVMSYPLGVYALAAIYLSEPVIVSRLLGAVLIIVGITLIAQDPQEKGTNEEEESNPRILLIGLVFASLTILFWALSDFSLQVGLIDVDPLDANFVRFALGSLLLLPVAPFSRTRNGRLADPKFLTLILLTGIVGFGVPILLMTYSVSYIGATVMSIIMAASPLFGTPLSILYLKEKVTRLIGLGTIIIFIGIILVIVAI